MRRYLLILSDFSILLKQHGLVSLYGFLSTFTLLVQTKWRRMQNGVALSVPITKKT